MTLRPAPGQQLSAGRLRVDAAKAIAKLREYQLVDRTAWVLEAIRGAVAAGATSIDLQGDSNDVWLAWAGTPWSADDLPRLFDELVSPEPGAERHHLRLLAAAVNSALGANPAFVDVYAIGDGGAVRARYTPDVLEAPSGELEESPLRRVRAEPANLPWAAPPGMLVHYRRRASLEVVSYWLRSAEPPELVVARTACADIATPIRVGQTRFERAQHADVVRVPLGNDLDGFLALVDTTLAPPQHREVLVGIAERGVLLETATFDLGLPELVAPVPLRLVIDGPRMPTNASRSEVRRDGHPIEPALRRAREIVPELIASLVTKLSPVQTDPRARHAALHLLASVIGGSDWVYRTQLLDGPLRALAELPLVRDAAGVPRPIAWGWNGLVYAGAEPFPPELAPWLSQVLWAPPGDPTAAITTGTGDPAALKRHLRTARRERRAEKKFYRHAPREPRVLGRRKPRVRARLGAPLATSCILDDTFAGLAGEVCVYRDRQNGELTLLLGGREIETVQFDSPIGFAAVIDSARLRPTDRFRGVMRDTEYDRVIQAMRAGVVRAIEAVALARAGTFVDGYHVAVEPSPHDPQLVKHGIFLARNLGAALTPPLAQAAVWRTSDGEVSLDALRAPDVIGIVPATAEVHPLAGRLIVACTESERALLDDVLAARLVDYEPFRLADPVAPHELALQVMGSCMHALTIHEDGLVAAIVPADKPMLVIGHRGVKLAELPYTPALAPCTIAIDCDRVEPDDDWEGLADDAGLAARDYRGWEQQFAREIAKAIVGERSPDLIGGGHVDFTGPLGRWFCTTINPHPDPIGLLGHDVMTRLRTCSMFRVLGEPHLFSLDELAVKFPDTISYVDQATEPVEGFPVVLADTLTARTIAKLAARKLRNAVHDLEERRAQLARELRLGMHRAKPRQELVVPYGGASLPIESTIGRGVVGVGRDRFEVHVLFESRLFQTITLTDIPLAAVFEIDHIDRADAKFEALRADVIAQIVDAVRARGAALMVALAVADPAGLADVGARRTLLASWIEKRGLTDDVRTTLVHTMLFPTVHGERATVADARRGSTIVITTWHGEWLPPEGDPNPALDRPILQLAGSPELAVILGALGSLVDVTAEIEKLQAQRRIARGLLPTPIVPSAVPAFARKLAELGPAFRHLGPGEIALSAGMSEVLLHANGRFVERVAIECAPSIQLAIEAPDLVGRPALVEQRLGPDARQLAVLLARQVLASQPADALSPELRRGMRRAILMGRLVNSDAPVFETTTGAWIDLAAVQAQRELFGNLWCVPDATADKPLDERRIVLVLSGNHMEIATQHGIPVVDATIELALDAKTRTNRTRPPAQALAIGAPTLAQVELDGDGITAPRGVVGVLAPLEAYRRATRFHRSMHPFDETADPCRWPTIAVVDDARFTPDRCWAAPERDAVYKDVIDRIHKASNEALRQVAPPPAGALASIRVAPWTYDTVAALRSGDIQVRGTLWLAGPPLPPLTPHMRVIDMLGERIFTPLRGTGLTGTLYVHATKGWNAEQALEELCAAMHAKLVREIAFGTRRDPDVVAAHVAWALSLGRIAPAEAKHLQYACFRPVPLDATQLHAVFTAREPVVAIRPETRYDGFAFVDDGSHTARIIREVLGARLCAPRRRADTVEPPPPKPVVDHPLQSFVNEIHARIGALGIKVPAWRIVDDRQDPIVNYASDHVLELAGRHRHVIAIAGAVAARSAWAGDAVDALAAHCVTVLNVALTEITDAAEASAIARLLG